MKTELNINNDILRLTNEIENTYPELLKYISEIPVKDVFKLNFEINSKNLLGYYNTLKIILEKYKAEHLSNNTINV